MAHIPTLKQLKYLVAVVDCAHFGKAAKACYISQSTLSSGIAELEDNLGIKLLERDSKGIRPTTIGVDIYHRAQQILTSTSELVTVASAAKEPFTTELRMGVIPTIAPFILPTMLGHIRKLHPKFKIYIREDLSKQLVSGLHAGDLDMLLLALPFPAENVVMEHLFYDDFLVAYQPSHQIADKKTLKISDLFEQDLLLLEDGHCIRDHVMDACRIKADAVQLPYQATSLNTIIQMVANDMGITILPKMAVDANILQGTNVKTRSFSEANVWRSIGLMWRNKSSRQDEFRALGQLIVDALDGK